MKQHDHFLNSQHSATFVSPATPEEQGGRIPKGWSSERVPHTHFSSRSRHVNASSIMSPFSSGRALPSKWDDAERWICSPVFGQEGSYSSKSLQVVQSERRAKSKSGPLAPRMLGNYGNYSPLMPVAYGGVTSMEGDSPFLGQSNNSSIGGGRRRSCPGQTDQDLACTREWLNLLNHPPHPQFESQEENQADGVMEEAEIEVTRVFSRRDMGTQMLPSDGSSSFSSPPPEPPDMDEMVKDVKVDKEDTLPITQKPRSRSPPSQPHSDSGAVRSKLEREEAKINEWENQQREKAEAAIRKLEMKLEKKRSKSMEKIIKKLKRAELKAGKMRASLSESNGSKHQLLPTITTPWIARRTFVANCLACASG